MILCRLALLLIRVTETTNARTWPTIGEELPRPSRLVGSMSSKWGASAASSVGVFGITAGYVLLAERLTVRQWIGAGIVVAAVAAATLVR